MEDQKGRLMLLLVSDGVLLVVLLLQGLGRVRRPARRPFFLLAAASAASVGLDLRLRVVGPRGPLADAVGRAAARKEADDAQAKVNADTAALAAASKKAAAEQAADNAAKALQKKYDQEYAVAHEKRR